MILGIDNTQRWVYTVFTGTNETLDQRKRKVINNKSTQEEQNVYFAAKIAEFYALVSEIESVTGSDLTTGRQNFAESWERNKLGRFITVQNAANWIVAQIEQQQRILTRKQQQKIMFPD